MKKLIRMFEGLCLCVLFAACGVGATDSREVSGQNSFAEHDKTDSSAAYLSGNLETDLEDSFIKASYTESDKKMFEAYAIQFAQVFYAPFGSACDLDPDVIAWFSFWTIYENEGLTVSDDGYCLIPKKDLDEFIATRFGPLQTEYSFEAPEYDAEKEAYKFYPLGEGSQNDVRVQSIKWTGDTIDFTMEFTEKPMGEEQLAQPKEWVVEYRFIVKSADGVSYLQIVWAKSV